MKKRQRAPSIDRHLIFEHEPPVERGTYEVEHPLPPPPPPTT
jgi:hypothetical protein